MWFLYTLIIILILIIILSFSIGFFIWKKSIPTPPPETYIDSYSKDADQKEIMFREYLKKEEKELESLNLEEVYIKSFDGLKLHAYYKEAPIKTSKTIISVHGYHGRAFRISPAFSKWLIDYNYNILFLDLRSYGKSEGKYTTYGVFESKDLMSWIEYLKERFNSDVSIALFGISMGGNTVALVSNKVSSEVKCIIDDCGFTTPFDEMKYVLKRDYHLPAYFLYFTDIISRLVCHFSIIKSSSIKSLKSSRIPVLFIHGDKDTFVPTSMGKENYEACTSEKEIKIFEGSRHIRCYYDNKEEYQRIVLDFLVKYL